MKEILEKLSIELLDKMKEELERVILNLNAKARFLPEEKNLIADRIKQEEARLGDILAELRKRLNFDE